MKHRKLYTNRGGAVFQKKLLLILTFTGPTSSFAVLLFEHCMEKFDIFYYLTYLIINKYYFNHSFLVFPTCYRLLSHIHLVLCASSSLTSLQELCYELKTN
jgi:hypothetical protein